MCYDNNMVFLQTSVLILNILQQKYTKCNHEFQQDKLLSISQNKINNAKSPKDKTNYTRCKNAGNECENVQLQNVHNISR